MYYHRSYVEKVNLPSGLGYEAVGTVTAVGPEVDPSLVGKCIGTIPGFSMNQYPALAKEAVVPASVPATLPESSSAAEGAAVWTQYCTAYGALVPFGKVSTGDFVIITAASSSVGLAEIQIVKAQGGISIATTRTAAKTDELLALGAEHVIVTEEEDLVDRIKESPPAKGTHCLRSHWRRLHQYARAGDRKRRRHLPLWHALRQANAVPHRYSRPNNGMFGYSFNELRGTSEWETALIAFRRALRVYPQWWASD